MRLDELSGAAAAVRDGVTVAEHAGGLADREQGLACTPQTRFQIASVSKQFTAAAVLLLATRSRLSLDDPVGRWLDGCPPAWDGITVHHLLSHTAGLGHWEDFPALSQYQPADAEEELAIFQREPLLSAPGERYYYSSPGYVLLAWIAERASGQPYASFLAGEIFRPLGLRTASAGDPPGGAGMARGYHGAGPAASYELATVNIGAGDVWCTTADLLRWDAAFAGDELLPGPVRELMLAAHAVPDPVEDQFGWAFTGYGYGWQIGRVAGRRAYCHTGGNAGYRSLNAWLPDQRLFLAVLTNDDTTELAQPVSDLLDQAG